MPKTKLSLPLARDTTFYTFPGQWEKRGALMHGGKSAFESGRYDEAEVHDRL